MKLLFDQNLARKLPKKLADLHPGPSHVLFENLDAATDIKIRQFAAANGYTIITRDGDFADLDALYGPPPKAIWITRENASTSEYERLVRGLHEQIEAFAEDKERSLLVVN